MRIGEGGILIGIRKNVKTVNVEEWERGLIRMGIKVEEEKSLTIILIHINVNIDIELKEIKGFDDKSLHARPGNLYIMLMKNGSVERDREGKQTFVGCENHSVIDLLVECEKLKGRIVNNITIRQRIE